MARWLRTLSFLALLGFLACLGGAGVARAQQVVTVAVSPGVVPVGALPAVKSSLLVTATVGGVAAGTTVACTVTLTLEPSGTVLSSKTANTSPAPSSGVTSLSTLFTISGGTPAGSARAAVACGGSSAFVLFRISLLVALNVSPLIVPAGGILTLNLLIATNAPLPLPAQCTIAVTDPAGSGAPFAFQVLSVSGGSSVAPAAASVAITLPATSPIGQANAAASCVLSGVGTAGDSADFTVTDPGEVTLVAPPTFVAPGGVLTLSAITLPGFGCIAQLTLPDGERLSSTAVSAGATGVAALSLLVPALTQPGSASLIVVCTDPANPANSADSAAQTIAVLATTAGTPPPLPVTASLANTPLPVASGGLVSIVITVAPGALCSITGLLNPDGTNRTIGESTASGVAPATGILSLSFHVPAAATSGTSVVDVGCSAGGLQGAAQLALAVGVAASCEGLGDASAAAVPPGAAPLATAGGPYSGSSGTPIQFTGAGSQPSAGAVLITCLWSFGDGQAATGLSPTHAYAAAGSYPVTLSVSDSDGLSTSASATATVSGFVPLCSEPALTASTALGACVTGLNCPATSLPGRCLPPCTTYTPLAVTGEASCPQPTTTVRILTGGPYSGQLFQPMTFQATADVSGTRRLCSADATLGAAGPFCHLAPAVTLPKPVDYAWDFGDGATRSGQAVVHAYSAAGTYTVALTVTFDDDSTASATTQALIAGAPAGHQAALVAGCSSVDLSIGSALQASALAGMVAGARATAVWAIAPGQALAAWFPDGAAPQTLTAISGGEPIWVCADGPGTLTLPD